MWRLEMRVREYNFTHKMSNTSCALHQAMYA